MSTWQMSKHGGCLLSRSIVVHMYTSNKTDGINGGKVQIIAWKMKIDCSY